MANAVNNLRAINLWVVTNLGSIHKVKKDKKKKQIAIVTLILDEKWPKLLKREIRGKN